jgi:hypothetical protein
MDEYGRGTRISKGMVDIYFASKDYIDAYRALRRAQKRGEENEEEKLFEAVARMRELVAHCVLYLRENPRIRMASRRSSTRLLRKGRMIQADRKDEP